MKTIVFLSFFCSLTGSQALPTNTAPTDCAIILKNGGASETFADMVAHGIHGMTLDDLKVFDPSATEDNYVPTVDHDLRSEQAIISYAKDIKASDNKLRTEGMKVLDMVITHMNDNHWDIVGFTALERVAHIFHMREMWAHTKDEFDRIGKTIKTPSDDVCECAMDVDNNGIMKMLRFVAMALREPSLVYGDPVFSSRKKDGVFGKAPKYQIEKLVPIPNSQQKNKTLNPDHGDMKNAKDTNTEDLFLRNFKDSMPPLTDAKSWEYWKDKFSAVDHGNLALFLHCAIAKAHNKNNV